MSSSSPLPAACHVHGLTTVCGPRSCMALHALSAACSVSSEKPTSSSASNWLGVITDARGRISSLQQCVSVYSTTLATGGTHTLTCSSPRAPAARTASHRRPAQGHTLQVQCELSNACSEGQSAGLQGLPPYVTVGLLRRRLCRMLVTCCRKDLEPM